MAQAPKSDRKPFEIFARDTDKRDALALDLSQELDNALSVRGQSENDVAYFHTLYEQGRTRNRKPWADAADLTSFIGTEKVDAMRARIVRTAMVEPVFTVEGWGEAASKAPFVEEFLQWQIETSGFQQMFARAVHLSLIEMRGVLEVYEDTIRRPVRKTIRAALQLAEDGTALVDAKMEPVLQTGPDGNYVEVVDQPNAPPDALKPFAEVEIDAYELISRGPRLRTLAYRDYLSLPAHARDRSEVTGHAKRFYRTLASLKERVRAGMYDKAAVEALGGDDEHVDETSLSGESMGVAAKEDDQVEKELYELLILRDLDGKGPRWWVATLHKDRNVLLRLQYHDIGASTYFSLVPFPKPNTTEGYSFIGHKLITVIEEHTAWRNMDADGEAMRLQAPIKRQVGALWDPEDQPFGPKQVIDVRDMRELELMQMQDLGRGGMERIQAAERAAERIAGIADTAAGIINQERRTATETNSVSEASFVRMDEAIKNIQEPLEEIAQVMMAMWKRALADMGEEGIEIPNSVLQGLEYRGVDVLQFTPNKKVTAQMLEGAFRYKPRGSVETADKGRQRQDFTGAMQALSGLSQANPMIAAIMQTPQAAKALLEQVVRLFNIQDKQAFIGSEAMNVMKQMVQQQQAQAAAAQQAQAMGMPPGPGGPEPPPAPPMGMAA